jgi:hemerythrin
MEVAWNSRYDTGLRVIDDQHRELFAVVGRFRRLAQTGAARSEVETLLGELVACSERHFATEEAIMSQFAYPDLSQHVSEHITMLASLRELLVGFRESQQSTALLVPALMEGWLKHHVSDGDFGFVTFLKAHNLA